jgi:hypothetical protein
VERVARQHARGEAETLQLVSLGMGLLNVLLDTFDHRGPARFGAHLTLELQKTFARNMDATTDTRQG